MVECGIGQEGVDRNRGKKDVRGVGFFMGVGGGFAGRRGRG